MNKGKKIFSIGQIIMVIGSIAYLIDLLFVEAAWFSRFITVKVGAVMPQLAAKIVNTLALPQLPSTIVKILAVIYAVAIVLMLIGWIMKRKDKKAE